jgi:RNA polymerase sigma-70 factor (ECF subfamily)
LYDRHVRAVYGAVVRYLRDPAAAEEVVQETYLAAWQRSDRYAAEKGSLIGWLLSIARNRAIDRLRAASRRPQLVGLAPSASDGSESDLERLMALGRPVGLAATAEEPPDVAERRWVRSVVRTALDGMSEPERQVLELAYDDGLTQTEIAERLGWPLGTVKTRTRRAMLRLRAMLESVPDIGPWAARRRGRGSRGTSRAARARGRDRSPWRVRRSRRRVPEPGGARKGCEPTRALRSNWRPQPGGWRAVARRALIALIAPPLLRPNLLGLRGEFIHRL